MRNPNFGNKFKFVPNTRIHRNLSGELRTYQGAVPTWEGFEVSYEAFSLADITTLTNFFIASVGEIITLEDFESRLWTGVITSQQIIITEGRNENDQCNWQTNFAFEGQVTGTLEPATSNPTLTTTIVAPIVVLSAPNFPTYSSGAPLIASLISADSLNLAGQTAQNGDTISILINEASSINLTTAGSPVYYSTILNGYPAIELNGSFFTNNIIYPESYTAFIVAARLGITDQVFSDTANDWNLGWDGNFSDQSKAGEVISNPFVSSGVSTRVYVQTSSGFRGVLWRDGVSIATVIGTFDPPNGIKLGNCLLGAFGIYNGVLSDGDIQELSGYLMGLFGVPLGS